MAFQRFPPKHRPSLPLLIGRKPILEALQQGKAVEKLFVQRGASGEELSEIKRKAQQLNVPISIVPPEKLNGLTKSPHQGVVAFASIINYTELQDAIDFTVSQGQTPLFILLDGVTDVRNMGAIARSAWCCGAQVLIVPTTNSASINEEAIKTSAGAFSQLLVCRVPSVEQAIDILRLNGIVSRATELRGSKPIYEIDWVLPSCIIMGSEDKGISKGTQKMADEFIHIPMSNAFDSFNVSVAAGIVLYEAMKQRMV